jgi:glycosyltransferase involved in cell wall biosynthesis
MKKILIVGPVLSRSGYGEMARNAIRAFLTRKDLFDLYVQPTAWGATTSIVNKNNPDFDMVNSLVKKTFEVAKNNNNQLAIDISVQVSLPTEWKKIAPINIGYTAGIETNFISPAWLLPSQQMDKIIVISEHAKSGFTNTVFGDQAGGTHKVTVPVEVVHFPVKNLDTKNIDLELEYDFNFLSVCQWGPRKNLEQTIVSFIEEFKDEKVGLVIKTNIVSDNLIDKEECNKRLENILKNYSNRKCKVYLLHGYMSEEEINSLYKHPKIKAIVSSTHGEGYGLPLFEASYNELPVVATDWSGHLDFLTIKDDEGIEKKLFAKVDFELKQIAQEHVWQGVLEAGTSWAFPITSHLKSRMREVYRDYPRFKSWSKKLNSWVRKEFTEEKIYEKFINLVHEKPQVLDWLNDINEVTTL